MLHYTLITCHLCLPARGSALNHNHSMRHPAVRTVYAILPGEHPAINNEHVITQLVCRSHAFTAMCPFRVCLESEIRRTYGFFHAFIRVKVQVMCHSLWVCWCCDVGPDWWGPGSNLHRCRGFSGHGRIHTWRSMCSNIKEKRRRN